MCVNMYIHRDALVIPLSYEMHNVPWETSGKIFVQKFLLVAVVLEGNYSKSTFWATWSLDFLSFLAQSTVVNIFVSYSCCKRFAL